MSETALTIFQALKAPATYQELIADTSQKIRPFAAQYGEDALKQVLIITLSTLSDGLGLPVSGSMLSDASDLIIQEWPDTKLSDFLLFKKEMLLGRIGGQVDDKLWKWNTRSITQAWSEYYAKREDVFCEHREHLNDVAKNEYNTGLPKAYANASQETKEMIKSTTNKLEVLANSKRVSEDKDRSMPLDCLGFKELCEIQGLNYDDEFSSIRNKAETDFADAEIDITFETFLAMRIHAAEIQLRKEYEKNKI